MELSLFEKIFKSIDLQERSQYLWQLLEQNEGLKAGFLREYSSQAEEIRLQIKTVYNKEEALKSIEEEAEVLKSILEALDFEETDWDRWHNPSGHYMPDYEIAASIAEEEAEEMFEPYSNEFKESLLYGNFYDTAVNISMLMHGILKANINDPYNNLDDPPNHFFISMIHSIISKNKDEFQQRKFTTQDYAEGFEIILLTNQCHYREESSFITAMTPFLMLTIQNQENASLAWRLINEYNVNLMKVPKLLNHITSKLGNEQLWVESMEEIFPEEYETSILLMDYYYQHNRDLFEEKAKLIADRYTATEYLVDKIKKGTGLHIELLKKEVNSGGDICYYKELKNYLEAADLKQFIVSITDSNTLAKLLGIEKMYDELETLLRKQLKNTGRYTFFDFTLALKELFDAKPDLSLELVTLRIVQLMHNERSRDSYKIIAALLKESLNIKGMEDDVVRLIDSYYYHHKPLLPALKDEFRKAGLIKPKSES